MYTILYKYVMYDPYRLLPNQDLPGLDDLLLTYLAVCLMAWGT